MDNPTMDWENEAGEELESPAYAALRPLLESDGYTSGQDSDENSDVCSLYSGATLDGFDDPGLDSEDESFSASVVGSRSELDDALAMNETYQSFLRNIIDDLYAALEDNRQLQGELPQQLIERMSRPHKPRLRKDWHQSLVFHYPYFRDVNGMRAPMNEDERHKRASKEMDPYIAPAPVWTTEENRMLVKAVHNSLLKENTRALMNRKEALQERLEQQVEDDPEIVRKIRDLDEQLSEIQRLELPELLERSVRPVDWLHVAAVNMRAHRDAFACEMHWRHLLDVRLNRAQWTPEEDERLRKLAEARSEHDWEEIARELKTNRSVFQCAFHYASTLMPRLNTGAFSAEEDLRLLQLVSVCKEGANISWPQVTHFMGCRSKKQVVSRYNRSLHPELQHGRWTAEEDIMLLVAIKLYGSQGWPQVATLLPGRSAHQCREHYKDHYAQKIVSGSYTADEDVILLELVEKYGSGRWAKVAKEMPWRTPNSVLLRYKRLRKVLGVEEPRVADLENPNAVGRASRSRPPPVHPPRLTATERRSELYRRICRLIPTARQRHAALMLCKGREDAVSRDACLSLYQRMLKQYQGSLRPQPTVQSRNLNKAIAQFAQPLHRPYPPSLAAYEHQEWQAILNVLHDLHGLEPPPVDPRTVGATTVPAFEDFFRNEVLGVPEDFQPGDLVLPLLPPNETTVATFGRLVDRFANGRLSECLSVLDDYASYPELAAAFDADTEEDVRCSDCSSRLQLEEALPVGGGDPAAEEEPCRRCRELREARRNYDTMRARFLSYFFWPALMDSQKIPDSVELYPDPSRVRKPKSHYRRKKQRKPWVKKSWEERKRAQAMALAASCGGDPPEDDVGTSRGESTGDVAGTSGTQRPPQDPEESDSSSA